MSHVAHRAEAPRTTRCYVVTVSDTRTEETDRGGAAIVELLSQQDHEVAGKTIVPDDPERVRGALQAGRTGRTHLALVAVRTGRTLCANLAGIALRTLGTRRPVIARLAP